MREICCDKVVKSSNPLVQGIRHGDFLFLSGQLGRNPETNKLEEGFEKQTRRTLENLKLILESEGASMKDVLKTTIYVKDITKVGLLNPIYTEYFHQKPVPARSCVEISGLAGDAEVEIELIAAAPAAEAR